MNIAYNIDCMEYMKTLPDKHFELAIVDPPYGIKINMNMGRKKGERKKHVEKDWDNGIPPQEYFDELFRVSVNQIVWGGNYFPLPLTKAWIFWDKEVPDGVSFADGELAWTSFDKTLVKAKVPYSGFVGSEGKIHPTQKPVKLYEWLLTHYAKQGDKILDTHLGSGSSRIAAYNLGFDFVGCEIDEDYFKAQEERFARHTAQIRLFDLAPKQETEQLQII
jgi:site-specific DNA-methyltransferase (adenine-specific)